jgi:UDP-N-acetylglucosamine 2-epimerase (non-hydrolysing)
MKIMIVVGARPNFMKAAPIMAAMARHNARAGECSSPDAPGAERIECILVHTGQHYDARMSDAFFSDLKLPQPDVFLGAGSGSHAVQTAEIMKRFEEVLLKQYPDVVVVAGDVNSTIACALVAAKMPSTPVHRRPLIAHVEAGLRSFDRSMPEEINRVLTDHLSDILFVTEPSGLRNLEKEGIPQERVFLVGNTMIDSLLASQEQAEASTILERLRLRTPANGNGSRKIKPYALLTLHRPANVDNKETFWEILEGLDELARSYPIVFPAHPRTQKQIHENGLQSYFDFAAQSATQTESGREPQGIVLIDPQGYLDFLCLTRHARLVVTDSGGIQEETTGLGVPCVTVRENTERPITVEAGTNVLAGVRREGIRQAIRRQLKRTGEHIAPYLWDGEAGRRIVDLLVRQSQATRVTDKGLPEAIAR